MFLEMIAEIQQRLEYDIKRLDSGIDTVTFEVPDAMIASLYRQGQSTKWKIWFYEDGRLRITHPKTQTIPKVDINLEPGEFWTLNDYLFHFILEKGWI